LDRSEFELCDCVAVESEAEVGSVEKETFTEANSKTVKRRHSPAILESKNLKKSEKAETQFC